jgi:hypothetical protein
VVSGFSPRRWIPADITPSLMLFFCRDISPIVAVFYEADSFRRLPMVSAIMFRQAAAASRR